MNIIDIDNHNKLPRTALQCYILISPAMAAAEFEQRFGEPPATIYRVVKIVHGKEEDHEKVSLWLEHEEQHETS